MPENKIRHNGGFFNGVKATSLNRVQTNICHGVIQSMKRDGQTSVMATI
ncbi:hypothetical protein [Vibrio sp. T11.5]|nr:hypothetical protein [Vibrio sp. T11.5]MDA0118227.1 hypothetical protein [Vibrio sp. T11.5]